MNEKISAHRQFLIGQAHFTEKEIQETIQKANEKLENCAFLDWHDFEFDVSNDVYHASYQDYIREKTPIPIIVSARIKGTSGQGVNGSFSEYGWSVCEAESGMDEGIDFETAVSKAENYAQREWIEENNF